MLSELAKLKMPKLPQTDAVQYTGKGWLPVDGPAAEQRLRELQVELAQRQAQIEADGGE